MPNHRAEPPGGIMTSAVARNGWQEGQKEAVTKALFITWCERLNERGKAGYSEQVRHQLLAVQ